MIKYQVKTETDQHELEAVTFIQGDDLRFIGEQGAIVAIFTSFEWLKVMPADPKPVEEDTSSSPAPELAGE